MEKLVSNHDFLVKMRRSRRYKFMKKSTDLMLGCADSDFKISKAMQKDLINIIKQGDLSYTYWDTQILNAVNVWYAKKFQLSVRPEEFIVASGVIHLMQIAIDTVTKPGDKIIIQSPVYGSFSHAITKKNRIEVKNELLYDREKQTFTIDFADLEIKMSDRDCTALLFCSPHNPVGRVWTKTELTKICELAIKYNVTIISDEIWKDIVFKGYKHIPFFSLGNENDKIISLSSQGKTYNIGGAQIGYGISRNQKLISKMKEICDSQINYATTNFMGSNMLISGYTNPANLEWQNAYRKKIEENYNHFKNAIEKNTNIKVAKAECLYLCWLDFGDVVSSHEELRQKLEKHGIYGNYEDDFSDTCEPKFARFVIALDNKTLSNLIDRLILIFKKK